MKHKTKLALKIIKKELQKYYSDTITIFEKTFPCENPIDNLTLWLPYSASGIVEQRGYWRIKYHKLVLVSSIENLLKRWNRFKKIKAFT